MRLLFSPVKPHSHTMSMCVSSARAEPFRQRSHGKWWLLVKQQREFLIENLLVRVHFIIVMIK